MRHIIALLMLLSLPACDDGGAADPPPLQLDAAARIDMGATDAARPADAAARDAEIPDAAPDAAAPPAARDYCEATVDLFCPFYLRCGLMAVPDVATCRDVFLENCNAVYEPIYAALADADLLALNPDGVAACAAHLDAVECAAQIFDLDGPCSGMWIGQAPPGSACAPGIESFVCAPGSACVVGLDFCGVCEPVVPVGAACGEEVRCGPEARCVDGTCVARALPGAPCGETGCVLGARCVDEICVGPVRAQVGGSCANRERCPYKSECIGGICVEAGRIGEACDAGRPCASGACVDGACAAPDPAGTPCQSGATCVGGVCDGTCVAVPGICFAE